MLNSMTGSNASNGKMDVDRNRAYASVAALRNGPTPLLDSYKPTVEKPKVEVGKPVKAKKEKKKGFFSKVGSVLKGAADILFLDDIKTLMDPNASLLDKGLAAFSFLPIGKVVKGARLGVKAVSGFSRKADDLADVAKQGEKVRDVTNGGLKLDLQFFASKGKGNIPKQTVTSNKGKTIDVTPTANHSTTTSVPNPAKGKPNSSLDIIDKKTGEIKTRRYHGPDGRAVRDVDYTNHGNPKRHPEWPHEHIYKWKSDGTFDR